MTSQLPPPVGALFVANKDHIVIGCWLNQELTIMLADKTIDKIVSRMTIPGIMTIRREIRLVLVGQRVILISSHASINRPNVTSRLIIHEIQFEQK